MLFSLDVIPARKGDCLMVHFGKESPRHIIIDGGPRNVYTPHLKKRLQAIKENRDLDSRDSLEIDLLMVSHVDDDHIQGLLDMTKEMRGAVMEHRPPVVSVFSFWHNTFKNIIGSTLDELEAGFESAFGAASMDGDPPDTLTVDVDDDIDEETVVWNLKTLASIKQGAQLANDAQVLNFDLNPEFDGQLIFADENSEPLEIGEEEDFLRFTVIGPMLPELKRLHKKHQEWLKELKESGKKPSEVLAAYVDNSVSNLSSIVVLAEAEGKRMLLTGDARGDKIVEGLQLVGLLEAVDKSTMHVDILKVPHHGSDNNLDDGFFGRIKADHYVFSGNGEHGNPERESFRMLLDARGAEPYEVHLTYPIATIDKAREADWNKEREKDKKKKLKNPGKKVRPAWSHDKHSLAAFLDQNEAFGKRCRFVEEDTPHLIDLLDEVDF